MSDRAMKFSPIGSLQGKITVPDPVRLSRERWEMLASTRTGNVVLIQVGPLAEEIDGIVFLPATYVPAEVPGPVSYRFSKETGIHRIKSEFKERMVADGWQKV